MLKKKKRGKLIHSELKFMPERASKILKTALMVLLNDLCPK